MAGGRLLPHVDRRPKWLVAGSSWRWNPRQSGWFHSILLQKRIWVWLRYVMLGWFMGGVDFTAMLCNFKAPPPPPGELTDGREAVENLPLQTPYRTHIHTHPSHTHTHNIYTHTWGLELLGAEQRLGPIYTRQNRINRISLVDILK